MILLYLSTLLYKQCNFRRTFRTYFYKKEIFVTFYQCVTKFEDEIINNKTLEHVSLIFTELWSLANEIMLNVMQNFKFDFLENEFWTDCGVRFKFHFQNLT